MGARTWSLVLCALVLLTGQARAKAWCQLTTGTDRVRPGECSMEGAPLAWRRGCLSYSVDVTGGPGVSPELLAEVARRSFDTWQNASCGGTSLDFDFTETEFADCRVPQYRQSAGNVNTIAFSDGWPDEYDETAFAITTVWRDSGGEIFDADILFNPESGPYVVCPMRGCSDADGPADVDIENILTHEVGHFLGLAHSQLPFATMHATATRGETDKRILSSDDVVGICAIYPPGSIPSECDPAPRGGLDVVCVADEGCAAGGGPSAGVGMFAALLWISRRRRR